MAFQQSPSIASPPLQTSSNKKCSQPVDSSKTNPCRVCGSPAHIINYGALTCQSCRAFFRRHGCRPAQTVLPCQYDGKCEMHVQKQKRRVCIACRLAKCFAAGMKAQLFRKETQKTQDCNFETNANTTQITQYQSPTSVSQLPTLDLLHQNRSRLTNSEWTLLSNIVRAYDTYSSIPHLRDIIERLSRRPISLSSSKLKSFKILETISVSMQTFIRSLPDFQILTTTDQRSLLERNLRGASCLSCMSVTRDLHLIDNYQFPTDAMIIYGPDTLSRAKRLVERLDPDPVLIKLMLVILTFSSNCLIMNVSENVRNDSLLSGTFRLLGSQNVYVELLWKYMIYRYGYRETVIRFANFVKQILDIINHITKTSASMNIHQGYADDIFEKKRFLITESDEEIPLWGNK